MEVRVRPLRCPPLLWALLEDHHIHVRSGTLSRYVVVSWRWRLGVAAAAAVVLAWAGVASHGWLVAHLDRLEQSDAIARLARLNERLEARASSAPRLVIGLEELKAGPRLALRMAEAAKIDGVLPDPTEAGASHRSRHAELAARLVPAALPAASSSGRDWLHDRITGAALPGDAARVAGMVAEIAAARAEIARLEAALREAQAAALDGAAPFQAASASP
jgi:hypothetical protein